MTTPDNNQGEASQWSSLFRDMSRVENKVESLQQTVSTMKQNIEELVTRHEFAPVKLIVYGLAGSVFAGFIGAVLSKVFIK